MRQEMNVKDSDFVNWMRPSAVPRVAWKEGENRKTVVGPMGTIPKIGKTDSFPQVEGVNLVNVIRL